jgi:hypothetical protein
MQTKSPVHSKELRRHRIANQHVPSSFAHVFQVGGCWVLSDPAAVQPPSETRKQRFQSSLSGSDVVSTGFGRCKFDDILDRSLRNMF